MGSASAHALAALDSIDDVAAEGDLHAITLDGLSLDLDALADPIVLPDGRVIYPPMMAGEPLHLIACKLMDMQDPAASLFLRLTGPPGTGKSYVSRAIAHELWTRRGRVVEEREGVPFYGLVEMQPGPEADELFFRYDYVPVEGGNGEAKLVPSLFVEAMRNGWVVVIDEVNAARDVALLSINGVLDGRLALHLPATSETVIAQPGFAVILSYNPRMVGSEIPVAWRRRFPATVEVTSNWAALAKLGVPEQLVKAARWLDAQRFSNTGGVVWTPQFGDIQDLWKMMQRVGERAGIAFFISNLLERLDAGEIQPAEASAVTRMLDTAGYAHLKVSPTGPFANFEGYARAVTNG
ncbi:MAG TPA: AAA family ATPase [Solirubrobacteraceae bacterium]|jgi:hypothetical protein|nr:AAA family ATPase [Solirubrobacteraceae bacterium]